jgi:hypothetical protein
MKKLLCLIGLMSLSAFGQLLPPSNQQYVGAKLLNVQVRDVDGYKGPIFLIKYTPSAEAKWVRPSDPALNNAFLSFALSAMTLGGSITIVTGENDNYGFRSITVIKFDDPAN